MGWVSCTIFDRISFMAVSTHQGYKEPCDYDFLYLSFQFRESQYVIITVFEHVGALYYC